MTEKDIAKYAFIRSLVERGHLNEGDASLDAVHAEKKDDKHYPYYWCGVVAKRSQSGFLGPMFYGADGEVTGIRHSSKMWSASVQVMCVTYPFMVYGSAHPVSGPVPRPH